MSSTIRGNIERFLHYIVFEKNYSLVETYDADEAFLTGTFGAQTPVGEIDGRPIGDGQQGPVTTRLRELYKALIQRETA